MKVKRFWLLFGVALLNPLWFCILFYALPLGSIGPIVMATWPLNSIVFPSLLFFAASRLENGRARKTLKIAAIPIGLLIAVLQLNSYFPLTRLFGLDDFYWI